MRFTAYPPFALVPEPRRVIGHAKAQQQEQEKDCADDDERHELFMRVLHVHEEQHNQRRFDGRDGEGDDDVERAKISVAARTVTTVPTSKAIQMAMEEPIDEICSEEES